jgi:aminocarboxymuconate-semialdehyde decarboxylase
MWATVDGKMSGVIDVHAHVVLEGTLGCAGHYGPELGVDAAGAPWFRVGEYVLHGVRYRESPFMDVGRRLELNDRLGIDLQMLSPNPLTYFHHIEADVAAGYCRWHNDEMAGVVAAHPDRFVGAAQLPMQDIDAAVKELRRAVGDLGLVAAYIGTDFGIDLDHASLDPFWSAAVELDVPVFIHPAPSGIDGPLRDARLRRFDLELSLGFLYEETLAVACLLFGGVLDRHPGLDVCLSHGGGAAAFMARRLDHAGHTRPWARERPVDVLAGLRRLWFDQHVHDDLALALLEERVGLDRLVLGTNLAGWDAPNSPDELHARPEHDANARRLLRLPPVPSV